MAVTILGCSTFFLSGCDHWPGKSDQFSMVPNRASLRDYLPQLEKLGWSEFSGKTCQDDRGPIMCVSKDRYRAYLVQIGQTRNVEIKVLGWVNSWDQAGVDKEFEELSKVFQGSGK